MTELIKTFDPSILEVDQETGTVNLTRIAKHFGKSVNDWTRNKTTKSFLNAYASEFPETQILVSERGNGTNQGTWAIRQVALEFAQWINPAFKVFCIKKLDELFQIGRTELTVKRMSTKEALMLALAAEERAEFMQEQVKLLEGAIAEQAPAVQYHDEVLKSRSIYRTTNIAAELGMSAKALNQKLKEMGVQWQVNGVWTLLSKYLDKGYTKTSTHTYKDKHDEECTAMSTVWTEKGREFIHGLFKGTLKKTDHAK
jgi:phage antirepressor YoqD-like protein